MEKIYDYDGHKIVLARTSYCKDGSIAVLMIDVSDPNCEEDYARLTVCLDCNLGFANKTDSQFIDTNNLDRYSRIKIVDWLVDNGIAVPSGLYWPSGYCIYPLVKFTKEALANMRRC